MTLDLAHCPLNLRVDQMPLKWDYTNIGGFQCMENKETKEEMKGSEETTITPEEEVPDYEGTMKIFEDGDIVTGIVVKIDRDEILVDIGYKSEGVIPIRELSVRRDTSPDQVVSIGQEIDALVLQKEDKDGRLILSKKRAEYERAWERMEEISRTKGVIRGRVIEVVKGGLILDIGLRGFLPASLVELRRVKDLAQFVGQELECRIIEMDRNRNNVVLSRRAALELEQREQRQQILSELRKGQILTGTISSVVNFGAFVDLGGIDGLIHISELSWEHITDPCQVVSVGDKVEVKVLEIDKERERISLGLKQTQPDPWQKKVACFSAGMTVQGRVVKLVPFGVFVGLTEEVEGLVHISELAERRVESPEEIVQVGQEVEVKITDIDCERRRISLSLKLAQKEQEPEEAKAEEAEAEEEAIVEEAEAKAEEEIEVEEQAVEEVTAKEEVAAEKAPEVEEAADTAMKTPADEIKEEPAAEKTEEKVEVKVEEEVDEKVEKTEEAEVSAAEEIVEDIIELKDSSEFVDTEGEETSGLGPTSLESILEEMKKQSGGKKTKVEGKPVK
jgi:small subunit ribosomal protein S1